MNNIAAAEQNIDPLLDEEESAAELQLKPRTLTVWRSTGKGPRYLKIGRRVFYRRSWLHRFMAECEVDPAARREDRA